MQLTKLLDGINARIVGNPYTEIRDMTYDSRTVPQDSLFVALRGRQTDGHRFTNEAVERGAAALLVEETPSDLRVPLAVVPDTRAALADVAACFFAYPARALRLVGVTGTNGKTSTVRMIESILLMAKQPTGSIGTISVRYAGREEGTRLTTPESLDLQRTLAKMRDMGIETAVIEVSSHSLALGRLETLRFAVGVYTHLTPDHLDFHRDMKEYASTKALLFGPTYLVGTAVLNADDALTPKLAELAAHSGRPVLRFARGSDAEADFRTVAEQVRLEGSSIVVEAEDGRHDIELPLPGDFQIENALAAIAASRALDIGWEDIKRGIAECPAVPGRLERVAEVEPVVLVDYAHTSGALESMLDRIRPLIRGKLITVFGCGGDRDRSKRAPMARAACQFSDFVIATSDNPRTEDPHAILHDVAEGLSGPHKIIADRREAIHHAIELASPNDVVVIAGKGHEDYQVVGDKKLHFDDREEARIVLRKRGCPV